MKLLRRKGACGPTGCERRGQKARGDHLRCSCISRLIENTGAPAPAPAAVNLPATEAMTGLRQKEIFQEAKSSRGAFLNFSQVSLSGAGGIFARVIAERTSWQNSGSPFSISALNSNPSGAMEILTVHFFPLYDDLSENCSITA